MTDADRIRCQVPFCRRTAARQPGDDHDVEIICGKHWRGVGARTKRIRRRVWRRLRTSKGRHADERWARIIWERCKREAIEAAGGIG